MPGSSAETADQIVASAQRLIMARGYNGFSFRDVAEEVGIRSASIHYHFPTKADLAAAIVQRYRAQAADFRAALDARCASHAERLSGFAEMSANAFGDGEGFCVCVNFANDRAALPPAVNAEVAGYVADNRGWLRDVLAAGVAAGEFRRELDVDATAGALTALFQGALVNARVAQDAGPLQQAREWALTILR